jgi:uncharacterized protein YdaL
MIGAGSLAAELALAQSVIGQSPPPQTVSANQLSAAGRLQRHLGARAIGVQKPNNPFFVPVGKALTNPVKRPATFSGKQVSQADVTEGQSRSGWLEEFLGVKSAAAQTAPVNVLILYDTTNTWGWLGELYAIMAANLVSHFGSWTAMPVVQYTQSTMQQFSATIYIGSTYGEPLPTSFLSDVYGATKPIIWIYDNIWQLTQQFSSFTSTYGWMWSSFDFSTVGEVDYKGQKLKRYSANANGIMNYASVGAPATVLATCVRSDGTTFPWAVRSGNLTYIGEIPLAFLSEGDRYLIFCDLLFDALAPSTATRHRAFVRLEDIDPTYDAATLQKVANWLVKNKIPFGFQIVPRYLDPSGYYNNGTPVNTPLSSNPALVNVFKFMAQNGGTPILHGWTHQYDNTQNPYTAVTGDDCEFYRITINPDYSLNYVGPLPPDSTDWAQGRFNSAAADLSTVGLTMPSLHSFASYAGSAVDSKLVATGSTFKFKARTERVLYFSGLLSWLASGATTNQGLDYTRLVGQFFPYSVQDVYGGKVLADTLGGIEPQAFYITPPRLPADIIADAQRTLVVRDGVASFFFHPEDSLSYLQQTVQALQNLGYTFVSPATL